MKLEHVSKENMRLIEKMLTVSPVTLDQYFPKKFKVYKRDETYVYVPKFWALEFLPDVKFDEVGREFEQMSREFVGTLRCELKQDAAAEKTIESLIKCGGGILSLDCGFGKTALSLYIATKLRAKTMILVHKQFLMEQFIESIEKFVPGATITKIHGNTFDTSGDFVICMIQTMIARKYDKSEFDSFGFLIIDEAHHLPAQSFSQVMFGISFKHVLGLTATPFRKDGLTRVIHWFLGPTSFEARRTNQKNVFVKTLTFDHKYYSLPCPINRRGDIDYTGLITKLVELSDRTKFIAEEAFKLADTGRYILVLSHRRNHAMELCSLLVSKGVDAATYLGGDKAIPDVQILCSSYSMASEGFDHPRLSGLILATPASDVTQACGRILRGGDGNDPIVVDIVDKYSLFYSQFAKRKSYYRKIGFQLNDVQPAKTVEEQFEFVDD